MFEADGSRRALDEGYAQLTREAISFYEVASYVFRNGLYLDEEQVLPEQSPK